MRHGTLYDNRRLMLPLEKAVKMAIRQFGNQRHLQEFTPAELHFNPVDLPDAVEMHGLNVLPDTDTRPGTIRVTTYDVSPAAEFEMSKQMAGRHISEMAGGLR